MLIFSFAQSQNTIIFSLHTFTAQTPHDDSFGRRHMCTNVRTIQRVARCSHGMCWMLSIWMDDMEGVVWREPVLIVRLVDIMLELLVYARLYVCACVSVCV